MSKNLQHVYLTTCVTLLLLTHGCMTCATPKALKSVFVGRQAAQAQHEAKRAKYLAGTTKTLGQKLKLSKGGVPMESIGVQRLRSEIKYLESVEKTLKESAKRDLKIEREVAKAAAAGKAIKGSTAKLIAKQEKQKLKAAAALAKTQALQAGSKQSLKQVDKVVSGASGAGKSVVNQVAQSASAAGKSGAKSALDTASDVAQTGAKVAKNAKKIKSGKKGLLAAASVPVVPPVVIPPPAAVKVGVSDLGKVAAATADKVSKVEKKAKKSWWS